MAQGTIVKVAGPLIVAENMADARMYDVVRVSRAPPRGRDHRAARRAAPPFRSMRRLRASAPGSLWNPLALRFPWSWDRV